MQVVPAPQTLPHVPQLSGSEAMFVSQPVRGSLAQWSNPRLHAILQTLAEHVATAFVVGHTNAHPPQLLGSVARLVSQPFAGLLSQSAVSGGHVSPASAPSGVLLSGPDEGPSVEASEVPQIEPSGVEVSQPLLGLPSQSLNPGLHAMPQRPLVHDGAAFGAEGHTTLHPPQLSGSDCV
jgi:hypothetical protein